MFRYKTASVNHYYVKRSIGFRGLTISMTSEVEDKRISLTEVKPIKNGREKQGVKNVVKLNFFYLLLKKYFLYAHSFTQIDHSKFKNNTRKEEFQNCKTVICWEKTRGEAK